MGSFPGVIFEVVYKLLVKAAKHSEKLALCEIARHVTLYKK